MNWFGRITPASFAGIGCFLAGALATVPAVAGEGAGPYSFNLAGKAFDERCLKLAEGESIRYRFRASEPVDFNIHYHRGRDVIYPVKRSAVREADAVFRSDRAEDYCLMWEHAGSGAAAIEGTLERIPGR